MSVVKKIIAWYKKNARDLPWRNTQNPYHIWLSEIILQQTRVEQGLPYYNKFIEKFPNVEVLAEAAEDEVLKMWQGLGYYSRARNMHAAAKQIIQDFHGIFPDNYQDIKNLKGVGGYTAAAIASFAYNLPHAVVDGNVLRVISRMFKVTDPVDSTKGRNKVEQKVSELLDKLQPGQFNQAIMEFGAMVCKPNNPLCHTCIIQQKCAAYKCNMVTHLPVKKKAAEKKIRHFNYLVILWKDNNHLFTCLEKRTGNDVWKNLYQFPLIESKSMLQKSRLISRKEWKNIFENTFIQSVKLGAIKKHILTHQIIHARFYYVAVSKKENAPDNTIEIPVKKIKDYAVPRLIDNFINESSCLSSA